MNNRETFWLAFTIWALCSLVGLAGATHTPIVARLLHATFDSDDIEYAEGQQKLQLKKGAASNSVAFFRFEGDWDDEFGLNNGTAYGDAAFGGPIVGVNSATFDGTGDYVVIGNSPALYPASPTIIARIKRAAIGTTQMIVGARDEQAGVQTFNYSFYLGTDNTLRFIYGKTTFAWAEVSSTTALTSTSVSNCIAISVSGTSYAFYVEGASAGTGTLVAAINTKSASASPIEIGAEAFGASPLQYFFNGQMDDVAIFNSPLAQSTISAICANTLTPRRDYSTTGPIVNTVCLDLASYVNNDIINTCVPSSTATAETDIRVKFSLDNGVTYYPTGAWANLVINGTTGAHCVNGTQFADQGERLITNSPETCFQVKLNSDGTVQQTMGIPFLTDVEAVGGGTTISGTRSGLAPSLGVKGAFK